MLLLLEQTFSVVVAAALAAAVCKANDEWWSLLNDTAEPEELAAFVEFLPKKDENIPIPNNSAQQLPPVSKKRIPMVEKQWKRECGCFIRELWCCLACMCC